MNAGITRWRYWTSVWTVALMTGCAQAGSVGEVPDAGSEPSTNGDADGSVDGATGGSVDGATDGSVDDAMDAAQDAQATEGGTDEDAAMDAKHPEHDGGEDAAVDAGEDAAFDAQADADVDAGDDVAMDAEVDAGDAGEANGCVPGTYAGKFEGKLAFLGIPLFDISGDIIIEALTGDTGNELRIENGRIEGADEDDNPVNAVVNGVMDCVTYKLRDGTLSDGTYVRTAFNMTVNFDGVVQAIYTPGATPSVAGTWTADAGSESGKGTFSATLEQAAP